MSIRVVLNSDSYAYTHMPLRNSPKFSIYDASILLSDDHERVTMPRELLGGRGGAYQALIDLCAIVCMVNRLLRWSADSNSCHACLRRFAFAYRHARGHTSTSHRPLQLVSGLITRQLDIEFPN